MRLPVIAQQAYVDSLKDHIEEAFKALVDEVADQRDLLLEQKQRIKSLENEVQYLKRVSRMAGARLV